MRSKKDNHPLHIMMQKELEDKMFEREYKGFYYWEYVRVYASHDIMRLVSGTALIFGKNKLNLKKYRINLKQINKYFLSKDQFNSEILVLSHTRRIPQNNAYKNIFIDDVVNYLSDNHKVLTIEEPSWSWYAPDDNPHAFPLTTKNIYYTDLKSLKYKLWFDSFKYLHIKEYKKLEKEYEEVKRIISSWYPNIDMSSMDFKYKFFNTILQSIHRYKEAERMIERINPKIVLVYLMPAPFRTTLINICKKKGIPTVELQHGVTTETDPIYHKVMDISKVRGATDYVFAFGEDLLNRNYSTVPSDKIINIGFPFLKHKMQEKSERPEIISNDYKYILIISQSTIGNDMANFAEKLSKLLDQSEYKIIFKYHPQEFSRNYKQIKHDNIIEIRNEIDTYTLQQYCELQIGVYSTAVFEGLGFYLPTLVLKNVYGADSILNICKKLKSGIYTINDENDVLKYLENSKKYKPKEKDVKLLWSNSDLKEEEEIIRKIINKKI